MESAAEPLDPVMRAALGRLTENEKICLRRRLHPQTAKEMAIDLGISPHAVEKRLKMARAKLGVSSSLKAARLLAASEGKSAHLSVPGPSDLASAGPAAAQTGPDAAHRDVSRPRPSMDRRLIMISIAAIGALSFVYVGLSDASSSQPISGGMTLVQLVERDFAQMDTDKSGFIDAADKPTLPPGAFADFDTDRDGKVTLKEMQAGTKGAFVFQAGGGGTTVVK
ncbi:hypothetical protein H8M03_00515 [Sphingomonas sabuli]|uniref:EF-hand domain-containing protein n=1 Tax=Sphingomonas sabuli TaxID=2764186 RepID=A0A7G9L2P4_9SPHN|nr:sigma factor-like helix-turn-helix DNA-binding protein [Sphingomonas sabuli]QNM82893.1 hypothetical protein H8M03_00515 [Sphingomonas sabuli]